MRLYSGTTSGLIDDSTHNRIAGKLSDSYFSHFRCQAAPSEVNSWRNSLRAISQVFQHAGLNDHGVLLEYQLPQTSKRLACIVTGRDEPQHDSAVIVELKQWETCQEGFGNKVVSFVGGAHRDVLHPSAQVLQYQTYLEDGHTAFHETDPVILASCAYLHNYEPCPNDALFAPQFEPILAKSPSFTSGDVGKLTTFLNSRLSKGGGMDVLARIEKSKYKASKKLLEHVGTLLSGRSEYVLLDEQLVAFERVMDSAREGFKARKKAVIIIRGGPGTGKSVIALNLMAALSRQGLNTHYVTGSRAFTTTLREIVGTRASSQVKYFNSYMTAERDAVDIMICDESHRIRKTSNNRFTKNRSEKSQIEELFHVAKVGVYLLDDDQVVKPDEIGSAELIKEKANSDGCDVFEYDLEAQFRCGGNDGFVQWVNNTLEIKRTPNVLWDYSQPYDFKICDSVQQLDDLIRAKAATGFKARMSAGFCWKWSMPAANGTLVNDVVIGDFQRPWNAKPEATRLAKDIPSSNLWAYEPTGINQVGCVYTAQGFEFDYIGVIVGTDLVYRTGWFGQKENSCDTTVKRSGDKYVQLIKNTYRVLLTRGIKGCYVFFQDKDTEKFFKSRTENTTKS
jgi:DUF2075 family protein